MLSKLQSLLNKLSAPQLATDTKERGKALANYDRAIQNSPDYTTAYANRAFAYYKKGGYQDGVAYCNRAIEFVERI